MSSDNFYLVRRSETGDGFAALMGFASDDARPTIRARDQLFQTPEAAFDSVVNKYSEYGASIDPECELTDEAWDLLVAKRAQFRNHVLAELRWLANQEEVDWEQEAARLTDLAETAWSPNG